MFRWVFFGVAVVGLVLMVSGCGEKPYFLAGDEVKLSEATALGAIKGDPRAFEGKQVMVEGTVIQVCQGAGCWARVGSEGARDTMFVKSIGDKVLLPKTCAGDRIRVEGPVIVVEPEPEPDWAETEIPEGEVMEVEQLAQAELDDGEAEEVPCAGGTEGGCPRPDCFVSMLAVELFQQ